MLGKATAKHEISSMSCLQLVLRLNRVINKELAFVIQGNCICF